MSTNKFTAIIAVGFLLAGAGVVLLLKWLTSIPSSDLWFCYMIFAIVHVTSVGVNVMMHWWVDRNIVY